MVFTPIGADPTVLGSDIQYEALHLLAQDQVICALSALVNQITVALSPGLDQTRVLLRSVD